MRDEWQTYMHSGKSLACRCNSCTYNVARCAQVRFRLSIDRLFDFGYSINQHGVNSQFGLRMCVCVGNSRRRVCTVPDDTYLPVVGRGLWSCCHTNAILLSTMSFLPITAHTIATVASSVGDMCQLYCFCHCHYHCCCCCCCCCEVAGKQAAALRWRHTPLCSPTQGQRQPTCSVIFRAYRRTQPNEMFVDSTGLNGSQRCAIAFHA